MEGASTTSRRLSRRASNGSADDRRTSAGSATGSTEAEPLGMQDTYLMHRSFSLIERRTEGLHALYKALLADIASHHASIIKDKKQMTFTGDVLGQVGHLRGPLLDAVSRPLHSGSLCVLIATCLPPARHLLATF